MSKNKKTQKKKIILIIGDRVVLENGFFVSNKCSAPMCCLPCMFCRFVSHKTRVTSVVGTATDARVFRPPRTPPPAPAVGHNYCARPSTPVLCCCCCCYFILASRPWKEEKKIIQIRVCAVFSAPAPGRPDGVLG